MLLKGKYAVVIKFHMHDIIKQTCNKFLPAICLIARPTIG